jgi:hypothetical protein
MHTGELIRLLAEDCRPVQPLRRPWIRTAEWLGVALLYVALVVFVVSPRADLAAKASDWHFIVEQLLALATGIAAAAVALAMIIPGHSRKLPALPFLSLSIWFASLGQAYVQGDLGDWTRLDPGGLSLHPDWYCVPAIALVGSVPAIVMTLMLHRGAPLTPHLTAVLGGLAAAALGNFGIRFFCTHDGSLMVLAWQFGTVCVLSALAGCAGHRVLTGTAKAHSA